MSLRVTHKSYPTLTIIDCWVTFTSKTSSKSELCLPILLHIFTLKSSKLLIFERRNLFYPESGESSLVGPGTCREKLYNKDINLSFDAHVLIDDLKLYSYFKKV